jgi:hypothetical protein
VIIFTTHQATRFRIALMADGFILRGHDNTTTHLERPGIVSVILTTDARRRVDVHIHWYRARLDRAAERVIDLAEGRAFGRIGGR